MARNPYPNTQNTLLEEFHYYPFGMCFEVSKSPTLGKSAAIKYNSQLHEHDEFEDANGNVYGLEDYNFAFRNYDAQIGRWLQPDPLMQHPSPYLAMSNNPVSFTDPSGLFDDPIINSKGELIHDDGLNNGKYYMLDFAISIEDYKNNTIYRTYNVYEISRGEYYSKKISFAFVMMSANGGYKQMGEAYGEQTARYNVNHFNWAQGLVAAQSSGSKGDYPLSSTIGNTVFVGTTLAESAAQRTAEELLNSQYAVRGQNLLSQASKWSKIARGIGIGGAVTGILVSSYKVASGQAEIKDYADLGIGTLGLYAIAFNPVGAATIIIGATTYSAGSLAYDFYKEKNKNK